jgi:hypothetical protein
MPKGKRIACVVDNFWMAKMTALRSISRSEWEKMGHGNGEPPTGFAGRTVPLGWEWQGRTFVWSVSGMTWEEVEVEDPKDKWSPKEWGLS